MKSKIFFIVVIATAHMICLAKASKAHDANYWVNYGNKWAQWGSSWAPDCDMPDDISDGTADNSTFGTSFEDADSNMVNGCSSFEDKDIKKELTVNGAVSFDTVKAHKEVTVHGSASATDSTFKNVTVFGYLNAQNSTFSNVALHTTESQLDDCSMVDLMVKSKDKTPKIKLKNTTIKGDVEFKGKAGKLVLSGKSSIKGNVINGQIIKK